MILFAVAGLVAFPVLAQECADWSHTPSAPHIEPSLTGTVCRLAHGKAYVAGASLTIVDVSVWDRPVVKGTVNLPAPAQDLAVDWPRAYAACGDSGLVELDIAIPEAPRITRRYDPAVPITRTVVVGYLVVAGGGASNLHLMGVGPGRGPLVPVAVVTLSGYVVTLTKANGFLVVGYSSDAKIMDVRNPAAPVTISTISPRVYATYCTVVADGDQVTLVHSRGRGDQYQTTTSWVLATYAVSSEGQPSLVATKTNLLNCTSTMAASSGRLVMTYEPYYTTDSGAAMIWDSRRLVRTSAASLRGVSVAIEGDVIAAVGAAGLFTVKLPALATGLPATAADGDLDDIVDTSDGLSYSAQASGAYWRTRFGLLTETTRVSGGGCLLCSSSVSINWAVVDLEHPELASAIATGSFYDDVSANYDYCGGAGLSIADMTRGRAVVSWGDDCNLKVLLYDIDSRRFLGMLTDTYAPYPHELSARRIGRFLRMDGAAGVRWFDVTSETPLAPIAPVPVDATGRAYTVDDQLLVVYRSTTRDFVSYDMSDPGNVQQLAVFPQAAGADYLENSCWLGRRLFYTAGTMLHVADFSDPGNPVALSSRSLPGKPFGVRAAGTRVVLWYATKGAAVQVGDVGGDGGVDLHTPFGDSAEECLVSGDVAYVTGNPTRTVTAFDISNPEHPVRIGVSFASEGNLALIGGDVAAGESFTRRDCRDLAPPLSVVLDIRPLVKPSPATGYDGPAMVPVVVRGTAGFDVALIDGATIRFGPAGAAPVAAPLLKSQRPTDGDDPGPDGAPYWFRLAETGITTATREVRLTARTLDGREVLGSAWLNVPVPGPVDDDVTVAVSPNPFNPLTTISYALGVAGRVELAVYDLQGRRVRVLIDETIEAGLHAVAWNGRDDQGSPVASGVYFARLTVDGGVVTQRMALLK